MSAFLMITAPAMRPAVKRTPDKNQGGFKTSPLPEKRDSKGNLFRTKLRNWLSSDAASVLSSQVSERSAMPSTDSRTSLRSAKEDSHLPHLALSSKSRSRKNSTTRSKSSSNSKPSSQSLSKSSVPQNSVFISTTSFSGPRDAPSINPQRACRDSSSISAGDGGASFGDHILAGYAASTSSSRSDKRSFSDKHSLLSVRSARSTPLTRSNQVSKITAHKKVYCVDTLQYRDFRDTLGLFERKLYEFDQKRMIAEDSLSALWVYAAANEQFRTRTLDNGASVQERMFARANLQMLRYHYFVDLEANAHYLQYNMDTKQFPFLANVPAERMYNEYVQEYRNKDQRKKKAMGPLSVAAALAETEVSSHSAAQQRSALRTYVLQEDFWRDVYQDIRGEAALRKFLEYLPEPFVTRTFFITIADFFLQRLRIIGCEISDADRDNLDLDELHELNKNVFCYLDETDHAEIVHFHLYLDGHYVQQMGAYVSVVTPLLMREVLHAVTTAMCDNLRVHCYGLGQSDEVFVLLEDFTMACIDIVLADWLKVAPSPHSPQQVSRDCSLFESPIMQNESPPTRMPLPLSPICETPKASAKKGSFLSKLKSTFRSDKSG